MRTRLRYGAAVALVALVAACSGGDGGDGGDPGGGSATGAGEPGTTGTVAARQVPEPAASFLAGVAGDDLAFTADYHVLRKLGGVEAEVRVAQDPPWLEVTADDLVVRAGPQPATCRPSADRCVGQVREEPLAALGVVSRFATTGSADALATMAARPDAVATPSNRTAAGLDLRCLDVAVGGTPAGRWCLTAEGVFGFVDTVVARYELRGYATTADVADTAPGELVADDAFLGGG